MDSKIEDTMMRTLDKTFETSIFDRKSFKGKVVTDYVGVTRTTITEKTNKKLTPLYFLGFLLHVYNNDNKPLSFMFYRCTISKWVVQT